MKTQDYKIEIIIKADVSKKSVNIFNNTQQNPEINKSIKYLNLPEYSIFFPYLSYLITVFYYYVCVLMNY